MTSTHLGTISGRVAKKDLLHRDGPQFGGCLHNEV
jgi:hypothetical protein